MVIRCLSLLIGLLGVFNLFAQDSRKTEVSAATNETKFLEATYTPSGVWVLPVKSSTENNIKLYLNFTESVEPHRVQGATQFLYQYLLAEVLSSSSSKPADYRGNGLVFTYDNAHYNDFLAEVKQLISLQNLDSLSVDKFLQKYRVLDKNDTSFSEFALLKAWKTQLGALHYSGGLKTDDICNYFSRNFDEKSILITLNGTATSRLNDVEKELSQRYFYPLAGTQFTRRAFQRTGQSAVFTANEKFGSSFYSLIPISAVGSTLKEQLCGSIFCKLLEMYLPQNQPIKDLHANFLIENYGTQLNLTYNLNNADFSDYSNLMQAIGKLNVEEALGQYSLSKLQALVEKEMDEQFAVSSKSDSAYVYWWKNIPAFDPSLLPDALYSVNENDLKMFHHELSRRMCVVTLVEPDLAGSFGNMDEAIFDTSIYFEKNVYDIDKNHTQLIERMADWLKLNPMYNIYIHGYAEKNEYLKTDDEEIAEFVKDNDDFKLWGKDFLEGKKGAARLDVVRALKVAMKLNQMGIESNRIKGTARVLKDETKDDIPDNRKIRFTVSLN